MAAELPLKGLAVSDYRPTSSGASPTPSSFQSQDSLSQSEMKTIIGDEIKSATFYVDLTASILPVNPSTVQDVADNVKSTFEHLTDQGKSTATEPRFPEGGFLHEPLSYLPFTHLLNKIRSLKPDGGGILDQLPSRTKELSWEHIEVTFESKRTVTELVRQSGTYARCCFLSNQRRSFSLGIGFRFTTLEAYVFLFHRSGLSSSRPLKLKTREGFEGLVRHIVAILSKTRQLTAWTPHAFKTCFASTTATIKLTVPFTCATACVVVPPSYTVCKVSTHADFGAGLHLCIAYPETGDTPERKLESRTLTLSRGVGSLPDKFTYKQAYPIKGHSQEGPLLSQFKGQFGIADVIGYHNCGPEDPYGSTERFFTDAEFWNLFENSNFHGGRKPEERGLQCIALARQGKALVDLQDEDGGSPSPGVLLESILHAIIGE